MQCSIDMKTSFIRSLREKLRRTTGKEQKKVIVLAVMMTAIALLPTIPNYNFSEPVMFQNHDGIAHLVRLWHIQNAVGSFLLLPNWIMSLTGGLGSGVFLFNWFLPYYVALLPRLVGASLSDSIKIVFLLSNLISAATIYLLAKQLTNRHAALIAIPLYLLNPYRLNVIFTRGALGEAFAIALLPLVLYLSNSRGSKNNILFLVSLVVLIFSHNAAALITYGVLLFWVVVFVAKEIKVEKLMLMIIALGITVFFWLPAIVEKGQIHFEVAETWYADQFPSLRALLDSPWQYGPPQPNRQQLSMSFQLGKVHWLLGAAGLLFLFVGRKLKTERKRKYLFLASLFSVSILLQLKLSKPLWDNLPLLRLLIFPWRLQMVSILVFSLLPALFFPNKKTAVSVAVLVTLVLLAANRNHFPSERGDFASDETIQQKVHAGDSAGEFLPKDANLQEYYKMSTQDDRPESFVQSNRNIEGTETRMKGNNVSIALNILDKTSVVLNHYYFPGWKGWLDGIPVSVDGNLGKTNGRMNLLSPPGRHTLLLRFEKTPIRRYAAFTSVLTLMMLIAWKAGWRKKGVH